MKFIRDTEDLTVKPLPLSEPPGWQELINIHDTYTFSIQFIFELNVLSFIAHLSLKVNTLSIRISLSINIDSSLLYVEAVCQQFISLWSHINRVVFFVVNSNVTL